MGAFLCLRHQIPAMIRTAGCGSIVNNSSIAGLRGSPVSPAYTMSKHAVCGLSKAAAAKYANQRIRINTVCPGLFETELTAKYFADNLSAEEKLNAVVMQQMQQMGRSGRIAEIVHPVLWLLSEESTFVTGMDFPVDGGMICALNTVPSQNLPAVFAAIAAAQQQAPGEKGRRAAL